MKVKLVFDDWKLRGESIYRTLEGVTLSEGDFHSGTTFNGEIHLDSEQEKELRVALLGGYTPSFIMMEDKS